ncbi:MAG: hypothetical protein ACRDHF_15295 [Tepidiformaceae bacterium]
MFDLVGWLVLGGVTISALVLVLGFGVMSETPSPPDRLRRPPD